MSSLRKWPSRRLGPKLLLTLALLVLITLAGCSGSRAILAPASPEAHSISNLFWSIFAIAAVIFVLVEGWLILALIRYRSKPGAEEPKQTYGNTRLEVGWTIAPAIILAVVSVATFITMYTLAQPQPNPLHLKVIGHQWWWEVQYPDSRIVTATDIHVPVGVPVEIELATADVIHSFWVPELAGKLDVIPGQDNRLRFTANTAGTHRGVCAEFCGDQHANMGFLVIAEPQDQFDAWVQHMQEPAGEPRDPRLEEEQARLLRAACVGCHTIQGTPAMGKIGPNLTHFGSRKTIAALTLDNTPENLAAWIADPQKIKPGSKMPALHLEREDIDELADYLESLK